LEIERNDYGNYKIMMKRNGIDIEEMAWDNGSGSIYFRDPAGNLVEFITKGNWPVED
jgi:catechol 2,3-dioxygenase-like lactoylglutathione lyase family enzyme